jgi:hypothetical protein
LSTMSGNYDPLDLRGQERDKAEKEVRAKLDRENEEADLKWLMGNRRGRRVVWRLLEQSGVFRMSFNTNAMQMAFAEGNRNFGNRILSMIHTICPELYPTMVKEQTHDNRNTDAGPSRNDH